MRTGLPESGSDRWTTGGGTSGDFPKVLRLGVVAAGRLDPWDVAVFPAMARFGVSSAILGRRAEENPVPVLDIVRVKDIAPWRRIPSLELLGFKIHGFALDKRLAFPPSPFTFDDAIVGFSNRVRGFDVLMAFETYRASTYQACRHHPAVVVKVTENIPHNPPQISYRWLKHAVRRSAARFACVSELARDAMVEDGFPEERISIIPECVDTETFRPLDGPSGREDAFRIGFAGKMDEAHGFDLLLEVFVKLAADTPVGLAVAGDGPLLPRLRDVVARHGLANCVEYVGNLPYRRLPEFLGSVDVLCIPCNEVPGWRPQFGIVNIEAMACGKPIIATRVGATPEIVPPALQPYLVPPKDMRALEDVLRGLAADRALCARLGAEGREWVRTRYDVGRVAGQWASLIAEVHDAARTA